VARLLPASVEIINRITMAMASAKLMGYDSDKVAVAVKQTQLDYRQTNKPPLFRVPGGRVFFMFKMYSLGVYNLLGKSMGAIMKAEGNELTQRQGLSQLAWLMGGHTAVAGISGGLLIEPVRFVLWGMSSALGWDEEDEGWEPKIRRALVDDVGLSPATADALIYSPVGALPGLVGGPRMNFNPKLGLSHLTLGRLDYLREGTEVEQIIGKAAGPMVGAVSNTWKSIKTAKNGDLMKAISQGLPPFGAVGLGRDIARAWVYGDEGIRTKSGDTKVEASSFTVGDLASAATGFQPMRVGAAYEAMRSTGNIERYWKDRAKDIRRRISMGITEGTQKDLRKAFEDLHKFNNESPPGIKIEGKGLNQAIRNFQKRRILTKQGIRSDDPQIQSLAKYYDVD